MLLNYAVLGIALLLSVAAQILLKQGSLTVGEVSLSPRGALEFVLVLVKSIPVLVGLGLLGIAFVLWVWLLSKVQLNVVYPIFIGVQLVSLSVASWILFHESLTTIQAVGVAIIVLGVFFLLKPA
jgi:multidrug transporter EmrE-like cation transporter